MSGGEEPKKRIEIRVAGFGGQGVIMSGYIIGRAASIYDNKNATMTQSFGPEARGGACSAQIVISEEDILFPYVTHPSILVIMSQEACNMFSPELVEGDTMIVEEDLVKIDSSNQACEVFSCPATRLAEELGSRISQNVVMMGFLTAITGVVGKEAMLESVKATVPSRALEVNLEAFERGYQYGLQQRPQPSQKACA